MSRFSGHRWKGRRRVAAWGAGLLIVVTVCAFGLAACGGEATTTTTAAAESSVLRIASIASINTWDPRAAVGREVAFFCNVYEPLVWANPPGSAEEFSPCLATSWSASEDGLTWTFKLREGVKFHDGTAFNSAAVKYSLEATKDYGLGAAYMWLPITNVTTPDDLTVAITTSSPMPLNRVASSMYASWIFSPASQGKDEAWWNTPYELGTGPYKLVSYKPNEEIVFERNPDYWGGWKEGQFDTVVVKSVTDPSTQRQMLEAGEVDFADLLSFDSVPAMESNTNVEIIKLDSIKNMQLIFNTERKPLDDVNVRQALSYAIPYADIIQAGTNGYATQSNGVVPANLYPNDGSVPQYTYDVAKAKDMLAKAGYPDGGFEMLMTYNQDDSAAPKFATLVKEAFAAVGVEVTLQPLLYDQVSEKARGPAADRQDLVAKTWWPSFADGYDNYNGLFRSESEPVMNFSYMKDADLDALWDEAFMTEVSDPAKAQDLYNQAQTRLVELAPAIFLYDTKLVYGASSGLKLDELALNFNYTSVLFWYHTSR